MRFVVVTYGSQGDIRPLVALGAGLVRAGHEVVFPADHAFRSLIERHGLTYVPLSGDILAITAGEAATAMFRRGTNPVELMRGLVRMAKDRAEDWARETLVAAQGADAVLCAGIGFYAGLSVAQAVGAIPVAVALQPMAPTRAFAPPLMPPPGRRLPGWVNLALHHALLHLVWLGFRGPVNRARRRVLGLPPLPVAGIGRLWQRERWPMLHGYSRHLVPSPADWPDFIEVTGFWHLDEAPAYRPPAALAAFLADGPPPVSVGFGSMAGYDPAATTELVLRALGPRRAVLLGGWGGLGGGAPALPPTVTVLAEAPHDWIFPRMAAVVHHGGAGTTAAGVRAGVPAVTVPFLADQPFWAGRLAGLGIASAPLPRRRLTAGALAAAIAATDDPAMRRRAAELGARVRAEDGVGRAVACIEQALAPAFVRGERHFHYRK